MRRLPFINLPLPSIASVPMDADLSDCASPHSKVKMQVLCMEKNNMAHLSAPLQHAVRSGSDSSQSKAAEVA